MDSGTWSSLRSITLTERSGERVGACRVLMALLMTDGSPFLRIATLLRSSALSGHGQKRLRPSSPRSSCEGCGTSLSILDSCIHKRLNPRSEWGGGHDIWLFQLPVPDGEGEGPMKVLLNEIFMDFFVTLYLECRSIREWFL
jgi:hypothetical protein